MYKIFYRRGRRERVGRRERKDQELLCRVGDALLSRSTFKPDRMLAWTVHALSRLVFIFDDVGGDKF